MNEFKKMGHEVGPHIFDPTVQLSFIMANKKIAPMALRLDGIYFNTRQDWEKLNEPIKKSFNDSDLVIYQSKFNRDLTEKFFGISKKSIIINNGTCLETISTIPPANSPLFNNFSEVWCCSSSWRPHKRLRDNIGYFLQKAPLDACIIVIGENPDYRIQHPRVFYSGHLSWEQCISVYKRANKFVHLAFLDHCPNVVVDARASGCEIIVASSGGTKEIAGQNATIVKDLNWDLHPLDLYTPPGLDYFNVSKNDLDNPIDIIQIAATYLKALGSI